jgi:hypothetical protein
MSIFTDFTAARETRYPVGAYVGYDGSVAEFKGHCAFVTDSVTLGSETRYTLRFGSRDALTNVRGQSIYYVAITPETRERGEAIRRAWMLKRGRLNDPYAK